MKPFFVAARMFTSVRERSWNGSRLRARRHHLDRFLRSEQWARGLEVLASSLAAQPEQPRVLLLTAPRSGADTTTAVIGLGLCMARTGRSVVLVEADVRHARFRSIFGTTAAWPDDATVPGLADFIDGRASERDIETPVRLDSVFGTASIRIVTGGQLAPQQFAPLGSPRVKSLFQTWRDNGDVVLVDAPPVLEASDALLIAPRADGVLLVVPTGSMREKDAKKAKLSLESTGTRVLGAVVWV